ncbi:MerR family transcriptional regulator [Aliidiomarina shirensis]|uniref:MerR family transcriptional regulator n=2 Tax=Aliidiomarina shirensis TaxID=1048642 RepID=A0A432WXU3_9GAMM|nr:MerR family transcriptional regulator [Aliidiomarina shirensis]
MVRNQEVYMFTIGKLAKTAGVGVETLRFYQREQLLPIPEPIGKIRYYEDIHVTRIAFIKNAQLAGFTLKEIKQLLEMDASEDHAKARNLALQRLSALEEQINDLKTAQAALQKLAHECQHNRHKPCPIIASFVEDNPKN